MNLESLLNQITQEGPVIAYCNILSNGKLALGMTVTPCRTNCGNCHILRAPCFIEELTIEGIIKKLKNVDAISCVLFFDNFSFNKELSDNKEDDKLFDYIRAACSIKEVNVCLCSSRQNVPDNFKKYLTNIKFGE